MQRVEFVRPEPPTVRSTIEDAAGMLRLGLRAFVNVSTEERKATALRTVVATPVVTLRKIEHSRQINSAIDLFEEAERLPRGQAQEEQMRGAISMLEQLAGVGSVQE